MCKIVDELKVELKGKIDSFDENVINSFAMRLNKAFGMITYPVKIYDMSSAMGFSTYKCEMDEPELSGIIAIDKKLKKSPFDSNKVIALNINDNDGYQRFTVAYEIAHYIFDYLDTTKVYYNVYKKDEINSEIDRRANYFATCLLLPETLFRTQWGKYNFLPTIFDKIKIASEEFKVSEEVVVNRYKEVFNQNLDFKI